MTRCLTWLLLGACASVDPEPDADADPPPGPCLEVSETSLGFDDLQVDLSPPQDRTVEVHNVCPVPVEVRGTTDAPAFATQSAPIQLAADATADVTITFDPDELGPHTGVLELATDDEQVEVALSGVGLAQRVAVEVEPSRLPRTEAGCTARALLHIENTGNYDLAVWSIAPDTRDVQVERRGGQALVVAPGAWDALDLTWTPSSEGILSAEILVLTDDRTEPGPGTAVSLSGEAFTAEPVTETFDAPPQPGPDDPISDGFPLSLSHRAVPSTVEVRIDGARVPATYHDDGDGPIVVVWWTDRPPGAEEVEVRYVPQPECAG